MKQERETLYDRSATFISDAVAQIVSNFATRENVTVEEILALVERLPVALGNSAGHFFPRAPQTAPDGYNATAQPAVAIDQSLNFCHPSLVFDNFH